MKRGFKVQSYDYFGNTFTFIRSETTNSLKMNPLNNSGGLIMVSYFHYC